MTFIEFPRLFVEKTISATTGKLLHNDVYTWQLQR